MAYINKIELMHKAYGVTDGDVISKYEVGKLYPCTTNKDGSLGIIEKEAQND